MEKLIAFFEIPAADFYRAVTFYESIFHLKLSVYDWEQEKMAFFMENGDCIGSISYGKDFPPSEKGTLLSFNCENMSETQALIESNGGKIIIPKTKIEAENKGYFSTFRDCEGNTIGLYSDK